MKQVVKTCHDKVIKPMCRKLFGPKTRHSRVPVWLYVNAGLTVWMFLRAAALQPRRPAAGSCSGTGQTSSEPLTHLSVSHVMLCQQITSQAPQFWGLPWKNTCKCRHITECVCSFKFCLTDLTAHRITCRQECQSDLGVHVIIIIIDYYL